MSFGMPLFVADITIMTISEVGSTSAQSRQSFRFKYPVKVPIFVALLLYCCSAYGQERADSSSLPARSDFVRQDINVDAPYAGKYEARIGGSRESANNKLRLNIGASQDLYTIRFRKRDAYPDLNEVKDVTTSALSFGADFFTWTRLRAAGGFKFPVEAVDYYFGINSAYWFPVRILGSYRSEIRGRIAHISAHLVDGDPSFTNPSQRYMTYSREFVDLMYSLAERNVWQQQQPGTSESRLYAGFLLLFHTIPDTLGVLTPYFGTSSETDIPAPFPLSVKFGYEFRLNSELKPIGENLVRLGLKLGHVGSRGIIVEGSYYNGRSQYGQHFSEREHYFSLGFAVDY